MTLTQVSTYSPNLLPDAHFFELQKAMCGRGLRRETRGTGPRTDEGRATLRFFFLIFRPLNLMCECCSYHADFRPPPKVYGNESPSIKQVSYQHVSSHSNWRDARCLQGFRMIPNSKHSTRLSGKTVIHRTHSRANP